MYNENIDLEDEDTSSNGFDFKSFYYNNKKLIWLLLGIIIFIIFVSMITSCGRTTSQGNQENNNSQSDLEPVLVMNSKNETVSIGSSVQISASVTNYPNAFIVYSSSDENVAVVSNTGIVTGKNLGTAVIYAVYVHNSNKVYREECLVNVSLGNDNVKVSSIDFPEGDLIMGIGSTFDLGDKLVVNPYNAYIYQKHFESSNSKIVKVESNGKVTALTEGTTYVTASINNVFESKIKVIVLNKSGNAEIIKGPDSIKISSGLIKLKISETKKIDFSVLPVGSNINGLSWTSSNTNVATVNSNGEVKGLRDGSSTITVTASNGVSSKTVVEVSQYGDDVLVETLTFTQSNISLNAGSTYTITPIIAPANATNKTLTFTSSNPSVATVTGTGVSGVITANNAGTATITFSSSNGKQGSVMVTVTSYNNNNNNYYFDGGSSSSSSSSSGSSSSKSSSSSSSSTSKASYALITVNPNSLSLLSSSYTTLKIKTNLDGTINLRTSTSEIYFPSSQSKSFKVSANKEVSIQVRGSKSDSSAVSGYVMIEFVPSDSKVLKTTKNVSVTVK